MFPRSLVVAPLILTGCLPHLISTLTTDTTGETGTETCPSWSAPTNSWTVGTPPKCAVAEGYGTGELVPDARLMDQHGDEVSLWQFAGSVVLLDVSTIWCGPCQDLAEEAEAEYQAFKDQGFVYVTVLQEDLESGPVDPEDLDLWVDTFGLTSPVLADSDQIVSVVEGDAFPALIVIGRDLRVIDAIDDPVPQAVHDAIDAAVNAPAR